MINNKKNVFIHLKNFTLIVFFQSIFLAIDTPVHLYRSRPYFLNFKCISSTLLNFKSFNLFSIFIYFIHLFILILLFIPINTILFYAYFILYFLMIVPLFPCIKSSFWSLMFIFSPSNLFSSVWIYYASDSEAFLPKVEIKCLNPNQV